MADIVGTGSASSLANVPRSFARNAFVLDHALALAFTLTNLSYFFSLFLAHILPLLQIRARAKRRVRITCNHQRPGRPIAFLGRNRIDMKP